MMKSTKMKKFIFVLLLNFIYVSCSTDSISNITTQVQQPTKCSVASDRTKIIKNSLKALQLLLNNFGISTKKQYKINNIRLNKMGNCSQNGMTNNNNTVPAIPVNQTVESNFVLPESELRKSRLFNFLPPNCGTGDPLLPRIVNGADSFRGAWPWAAAIGYRSVKGSDITFICGGSLVTDEHVITAAHCLLLKNVEYVIRLGEYNIKSDSDGANPIDLAGVTLIPHPDYKRDTMENDIGIIKLDRKVQIREDIFPVCLPLTQNIVNTNLTDMFGYIIGWGTLYYGGPRSDILQQALVQFVDNAQCNRAYATISSFVDDRIKICAGNMNGITDACQGDSGGPLMIEDLTSGRMYMIGIVADGYGCGSPGYPGVYTRVSAYLNFINQNLK